MKNYSKLKGWLGVDGKNIESSHTNGQVPLPTHTHPASVPFQYENYQKHFKLFYRVDFNVFERENERNQMCLCRRQH